MNDEQIAAWLKDSKVQQDYQDKIDAADKGWVEEHYGPQENWRAPVDQNGDLVQF